MILKIFEIYLKKKMFLIDYREKISETLSPIIGAPPNQLSLILTMFSIIPFCLLNYLIHGKYKSK